jgi:hypothetical protein
MTAPDAFATGTSMEKLVLTVLSGIASDESTKAKVGEILFQFLRRELSHEAASARLEGLIGSSTPIKSLESVSKTETAIHPPLARAVSIPGYRKQKNVWTPEEDQRLKAAVQAHGTDNWPMIATLVGGGRTRSQCSQRWQRGIDPKIIKCNWSREEEEKLLEAVALHGSKAWTKISAEMGNRSDVQCRFRYKFLCKKAKEANRPVQPISAPQALTHIAGGQLGPPESILDNPDRK